MSFSSNKLRPNNIDLDSSQTLDNKTLTSNTVIQSGADLQNPSIIDPVRLDPKKDTLSNLQAYAASAQNGELVYATDVKKSFQIVDGALAEISGGSSGINYITNPDFETDISDWTGDTNLSISRDITSQLREVGSLYILKGAVDASGQSVTTNFTVDTADLAKKLTISFDYDFSVAGYADGDMQVRIIQDPNGTPSTIRVNGEDIKAGKGRHYAQFQTDATQTEYALELYWADTGTTAVGVYIDNVVVGPTNLAFGAVVTDWEEYTPTAPSNTTLDQALYRRVGDNIEIRATFTASNSSANFVVITATDLIPSGLSIDESKLPNSSSVTDQTVVGQQHYEDPGVNAYHFGVEYRKDTNDFVVRGEPGTTYPTEGSGDNVSWWIQVPIQGWSSNAQMSEDLGGREIVASLADESFAVSTTSTFIVSTPDIGIDTTNSSGSNYYLVPESGNYELTLYYYLSNAGAGGSNSNCFSVLRKSNSVPSLPTDGITVTNINGPYHSQTSVYRERSVVVNLSKGEYLFSTMQSNSTGINNNQGFTVKKLASPQTMLETETVAARYTSNAGQSFSGAGATTDAVFEDKAYDTHGAYNSSTGDYTIPVNGWYNISVVITLDGGVNNVDFFQTTIRCSDSSKTLNRTESVNYDGQIGRHTIHHSGLTYYDKGDVVDVRIYKQYAGSVSANTSSASNYFSIARIK